MNIKTLEGLAAAFDSSTDAEGRSLLATEYMTLARKMLDDRELISNVPARKRAEERSFEISNKFEYKQCSYNRCDNPSGRRIGTDKPIIWVPDTRPGLNFHPDCYRKWLAEDS